tara:strand:- start:375 stop:1694 length:1320 start_codon:yes stop_codon:yes gene_type:complete
MPTLDAAAIRSASRSKVIGALTAIKGQPASQWLSIGHPARNGQLNSLRRINNSQAAELLAAVGPNHCLDGWSYLSRALEAIVSGDVHAGRHLSYYAQLRAANSILAFSGIGVFNTTHFSIDAAGVMSPLYRLTRREKAPGTHSALWSIIEEWSKEQTHTGAFLDSIQVGGKPLSEIISVIWPSSASLPRSATASGLVFNLVESWGLDLKKGPDDRSVRNVSSYNPHHLNPASCNVPEMMSFVAHIWSMFEPGLGDGFDKLDRHILKQTLQTFHNATTGDTRYHLGQISSNHENLDPRVKSLAEKDFLTGADGTLLPDIMHFAEQRPSGDVLGMISRAALLLRTATAYTRSGFLAAGIAHPEQDLQLWLEQTGVERGYWSAGNGPGSMADLWEDIDVALSDIADVLNSIPRDRFDLFERLNASSRKLAESERAFLWGIAA